MQASSYLPHLGHTVRVEPVQEQTAHSLAGDIEGDRFTFADTTTPDPLHHHLSFLPVVFADAPNAGALELGVRAIVAEEEGRKISERTKAGLAAAKAKGAVLGNPNGAAALRRYEATHGHAAATQGRVQAADEFADGLRFAIERIIVEGKTTCPAIADALNASGFPTRRGGRWSRVQVARLLKRLDLDRTAKLPQAAYHQADLGQTSGRFGGVQGSCLGRL